MLQCLNAFRVSRSTVRVKADVQAPKLNQFHGIWYVPLLLFLRVHIRHIQFEVSTGLKFPVSIWIFHHTHNGLQYVQFMMYVVNTT